jgi:steroid delta-isomerase-like uncharacterized protein
MTGDELRAVIDSFMQAWNARDPEAIARFHTTDGVAETPMYSTLHGRHAIADAARAFYTSFPDFHQTVEVTLVDPPHGAVFGRVTATHVNDFFGLPGTGRRFEFRTAWFIKVAEDGLIEHVRRVYDFTGLLVQLGVLRAKPAKP